MARNPKTNDKAAAKHPPAWIAPQLTRLANEAPDGPAWLHEIKYDGYRLHARIDGDDIRLLTRTGLDWSHRYQATVAALRTLRFVSGNNTPRLIDAEELAIGAMVDPNLRRGFVQRLSGAEFEAWTRRVKQFTERSVRPIATPSYRAFLTTQGQGE